MLPRRRRLRVGRWRVAISSVLLLHLAAGCVDQPHRVAQRTLLDEQGTLDVPVFTAALQAKFPPASSLAKLRDYVSSLGGSCDTGSHGVTECELRTTRPSCYWTQVKIAAPAEGDVIRSLRVESEVIFC